MLAFFSKAGAARLAIQEDLQPVVAGVANDAESVVDAEDQAQRSTESMK